MLYARQRSYSLFLVELAERLPDMMKPSLAILSVHLDGESYTMRKCVLAVMGEIVAKVGETISSYISFHKYRNSNTRSENSFNFQFTTIGRDATILKLLQFL